MQATTARNQAAVNQCSNAVVSAWLQAVSHQVPAVVTNGQAETDRAGGRYAPLISIGILLIVAVGLFFAITRLPLGALAEFRFNRTAWWSIPVAVTLQLLLLGLSAAIWRSVVRSLTGVTTDARSAYLQLVSVAVGKYVPGKVWGFVARAGQMRKQNISVSMSIVSSASEQLLLFAGAIVVATVSGALALPDKWMLIIGCGTILFVVLLLVMFYLPKIAPSIFPSRFTTGINWELARFSPAAILKFAVSYAILWVISGAIFATIYLAIFESAVSVDLIAALVLANTLGIAIGFFAFFAPGGLGVREVAAAGVLAVFVPVGQAFLVAVAYRAWTVLVDGINAIFLIVTEARATTGDSTSR